MPELLEVEQYRAAALAVRGRTIDEVRAPDPWYCKGGADPSMIGAACLDRSVTDVCRHGKLLMLELDGPERDDGVVLGLRFGMTGRLLVDGSAPIERLEYSSARQDPAWDRFALGFRDGGSLVMRDPRRLGGVELDPDLRRLGPDAMSVTDAELGSALRGHRALKAVLLDQSRIAGLGNLLVDEALWRARLDPARDASSLEEPERHRLLDAISTTLEQLGERGGSHRGDLHAARRPGATCPLDGAPLQRRTIAGRTTYSCPAHQR